MKLSKDEREFVIGICVCIISVALFVLSSMIPMSRYKFIDSPRIFPVLVSATMCIVSVAYIIRSFRVTGLVPLSKIRASCVGFFRNPEVHRTILTMALIGVYYVFATVRGWFYPVSFIFLVFTSCVYIRTNPVWRIVGVVLFITGAYFVFYRGFHVQLL